MGAYMAAKQGTPILVFDMTTAPVDSIREEGGWDAQRDCFMRGSIDQSILNLTHDLGWLDQILDYLPHLCLGSLRATRQFYTERVQSVTKEQLDRIDQAIAAEIEREKQFYGDDDGGAA